MMTHLADRLADLTGLGEAPMGTMFLGCCTPFPEIHLRDRGLQGIPELAVSNTIRGIAVQTVFLQSRTFSIARPTWSTQQLP